MLYFPVKLKHGNCVSDISSVQQLAWLAGAALLCGVLSPGMKVMLPPWCHMFAGSSALFSVCQNMATSPAWPLLHATFTSDVLKSSKLSDA